MGNHYVIGDVHGCYKDLMRLLDKINKEDSEAQFIFVGDLIDRGPNTWEVLQWAVEHITEDGKYQSVRGNHEQEIIEWYSDFCSWWNEKVRYDAWGQMPKTYYDFSTVMKQHGSLTPAKIKPYISLFEQMSYSKSIEVSTIYGKKVKYRIVHGWYRKDEPEDSECQRHSNLWERNYWGTSSSDEIIVHGHTPTFSKDYLLRGKHYDVPGMVCYRSNAVNLDGGCCYGELSLGKISGWRMEISPCMLGAICLETLDEIYPYTLEERFLTFSKAYAKSIKASEEFAIDDAQSVAEEYMKTYRKKENPCRVSILERMGKEKIYVKK